VAFGSLSVKGRALRWLSQREHSRAELERKLARVVDDTPEASARQQIDAALDELAAKGLISEARVAESVLNVQGRRFGARRLKQVLQAKGLAPALVAEALQQAPAQIGSELERARDLWRRRFGDAPAADAADRARQMRFLAGRGFDADVVRRVVRGVDPADAADEAGPDA
jgi:regulatory protein